MVNQFESEGNEPVRGNIKANKQLTFRISVNISFKAHNRSF